MARRRILAPRYSEKRSTPKKEKSILANYDAWIDSLLERIGIRPKLITGLDEFLTVLMALFYAVFFFFRLATPFSLQETGIPAIPTLPSNSTHTNLTTFFEGLQTTNDKYFQCFSLKSVHSVSYKEVNVDDQLSVYNGHFTPAHTYVFDDYVNILSVSDAKPSILVAIPTEQSSRTEESLRITLAAAADALCSSRLSSRSLHMGVVLAVGRTYASIEHAFLETYGKDALSSALSLRLEPGTGWSGLQFLDFFSVKDGEAYHLLSAPLRKCKSCKQGFLTYLYEWILAIMEQKKIISLKAANQRRTQIQSASYGNKDNRRIVITSTTTGGFKGTEILVPPEGRWKRTEDDANTFSTVLIGSAVRSLSTCIVDTLLSLLTAISSKADLTESSMRPFLLVTGRSVHVPRMAIPVASAATLFVLLHTAKKYHQGSKRLLMKRLFIGIFSRLFVIALTASAGYLLVTFYPDFNSNSSALNFVTGMHRGLLSAIILFVTGASITIWGVFPLVPIPVSILEGSLFLIVLQPILLAISSAAPEADAMALQLLQISLLSCSSQLLSDVLRKRFGFTYPSLVHGITIMGAIILTFPTIYYGIHLLLNSVAHSRLIWSLTGEATRSILLSVIITSSVVLAFVFGHVGALMRRAPMRFLIGLLTCAASFVPVYYYCNRPSNDHLIKNMKHVPGALTLPTYTAHTDVTFWCFDDEKACSVDVYNGLYDSMELYDTVAEDDEKQGHRIQFFSQNVNISIPMLESHSITCASGSCTSDRSTEIVVISNTINRRYRYNSQLASVKNITGMVSYVCERVPMRVEESVYWRRTYKAYSCYHP